MTIRCVIVWLCDLMFCSCIAIAISASAGVGICLANLAKDLIFL